MLNDQKGAALITTLALSGVALLVMAILLHMITKWTSISTMVKSYATAREAAYGAIDVMTSTISAEKVGGSLPVPIIFNNHTSFNTKVFKNTSEWGGLNSDVSIDASSPSTYDVSFVLGVYKVFGKIVHTAVGNTIGPGKGLIITGVINTGGEIAGGTTVPTIHSVELLAQKINDASERVKISFVYEY